MDPLRFAIVAAPLSAYFILFGLIHLRRRPLVVTGVGDLATLGAALTGLVLVGPISLFRPEAATAQFGDLIWLFLVALYWLWLALIAMLCRPRLVIYNLSPSELRPAVAGAIMQLDSEARWAGTSLVLPGLGVQLHLDALPWLHNTSLVSSGGDQDPAGWRRLARALDRALRNVETKPKPQAQFFFVMGALMLGATIVRLVGDPEAVMVAWNQFTAF